MSAKQDNGLDITGARSTSGAYRCYAILFVVKGHPLSLTPWISDFPDSIHEIHEQTFLSIEDLSIRLKQYDVSLDFVLFDISDFDLARMREQLQFVRQRRPTIGTKCGFEQIIRFGNY